MRYGEHVRSTYVFRSGGNLWPTCGGWREYGHERGLDKKDGGAEPSSRSCPTCTSTRVKSDW